MTDDSAQRSRPSTFGASISTTWRNSGSRQRSRKARHAASAGSPEASASYACIDATMRSSIRSFTAAKSNASLITSPGVASGPERLWWR